MEFFIAQYVGTQLANIILVGYYVNLLLYFGYFSYALTRVLQEGLIAMDEVSRLSAKDLKRPSPWYLPYAMVLSTGMDIYDEYQFRKIDT